MEALGRDFYWLEEESARESLLCDRESIFVVLKKHLCFYNKAMKFLSILFRELLSGKKDPEVN